MIKSQKSPEEIYTELDADGDGVLTLEEIIEGLEKMNIEITNKEARLMKRGLDSNNDGFIWKKEFLNEIAAPYKNLKEFYDLIGDIKI